MPRFPLDVENDPANVAEFGPHGPAMCRGFVATVRIEAGPWNTAGMADYVLVYREGRLIDAHGPRPVPGGRTFRPAGSGCGPEDSEGYVTLPAPSDVVLGRIAGFLARIIEDYVADDDEHQYTFLNVGGFVALDPIGTV